MVGAPSLYSVLIDLMGRDAFQPSLKFFVSVLSLIKKSSCFPSNARLSFNKRVNRSVFVSAVMHGKYSSFSVLILSPRLMGLKGTGYIMLFLAKTQLSRMSCAR